MSAMGSLVGADGCSGPDGGSNPLLQFADSVMNPTQMEQQHEKGATSSGGPSHAQEFIPRAETENLPAGLDMSREKLDEALASYVDLEKEYEAMRGQLEGVGLEEEFGDFDSLKWFTSGIPQDKYRFQEQNPFVDKGIRDGLMEAGCSLFGEGRLDESIMAFEAFLRTHEQAPPEVLSDCWRWLGTANAENDNDQFAIQCLREAIKVDPENLEALVDMGVCCTNESSQSEALDALKNWMRLHPNPKVQDIYRAMGTQPIPGQSGDTDFYKFAPEQRRVVSMYEEAARIDPGDAEIHSVLGILYNLTRDYEKAEIAFKRALELDPKNYNLWNRLGATQANSPNINGSKEALHAYRKALELKPTYTRAWVNMGISYANLAMYDLSAKYYLKALSLNPGGSHVWSYLRIAFDCMKRPDLADKVK
eukprot:CAMPEP_0119121794 /NCGR_PEP_ID=MMETSP1310-20130426/2255_1 /TAXON_ID=464262 /ORGANISM="Genus nov. species nov., Strain RCC2339" /LENGTH=420 /DNA_ID=CAMNT_0007111373 /DNA_START=40 /DNA_END=1299 /DNA_ORIENTATION=-